jgi:capsular exopolysaccharide synthesis family protein
MTEFVKILRQAGRERTPLSGAHPSPDSTSIGTSVRPSASPETTATIGPLEGLRPSSIPPATAQSVRSPDGVEGHLVSLLDPGSVLAEPYRMVRHLLEQLHSTAQLAIVAVSSAMVGDGKTTTSINLAGALAQASDTRVLLVDADLRNSSIARHLALDAPGHRGLIDAILDPNLGLDDLVSPQPAFNLDVLPAGTLRPAPYEVLKSPRLGDLLEEARRRYDYVVVDTAPLLAVPDSRQIGKWVDGFLLVVAANRTPRKLLAETLDLMEPAKLIALLFNEDDEPVSGYSYPASSSPGLRYNDRPTWQESIWRRLKSARNV